MARPNAPRGEARGRVLDAALALFAEHGVAGTSLQMIADHLGVTKAAVYYQFKAKEDIVVAVLQPTVDTLEHVVSRAEAQASERRRTEVALEGIVDVMLDQRRTIGAMFRDPEMERLLADHAEFEAVVQRLSGLLLGVDPTPRRAVAATVMGAGLSSAVIDPDLALLGDDDLRAAMLDCARRLLL